MNPNARPPRAPQFTDGIDRLPIAGALKRFVVPEKLNRFYPATGNPGNALEFASGVLGRLNVHYTVTGVDLARIPRTGPVVAVANHPFGILEGLMLLEMLRKVRPDVKILANSILAGVPEMLDSMILVDPFETAGSRQSNRRGVRELISYLAKGGLLLVFPAGEVSHVQLRERRIADPDWNENIARFIRHSKATVAPIYIKGVNSLAFQLFGMIHPHLRTARLLHEFCNKEEKTIEIRVGHPISFETLAAFQSDGEITKYLRFRTYLLANRGKRHVPKIPNLIPVPLRQGKSAELVEPAPQAPIEAEIECLTPLAESGDLAVFRARAAEIPHVLHEIGRLRELTFRVVGEGTGAATDLDRFDGYYHHVFVWDREKRLIVGAYRVGMSEEILPKYGIRGFYTSTLFHFDERFFERTGRAMEMGRSFVRPEYQKQYAPLLLLWRGIGAHICEHPDHPVLFGPVSISNNYHPVSRRLIVRYLQAQESFKELAAMVRPMRKFRAMARGADNEAIGLMLRDSQELSALTADIESDGKGIPILLKQYLKLGGKLLGFNVDPFFSNALDGLILVDLRHTQPGSLQRYMGREGLRAFMEYHLKAGEFRIDCTDKARTM